MQVDPVQEAKYAKVIAGEHSRFALEVLAEFLESSKAEFISNILSSRDAAEAWQHVLAYKAVNKFTMMAEANVAVGAFENKNLGG